MRKRLRKLAAYVMALLLVIQVLPLEPLQAFAMTIVSSTEITEDVNEDLNIMTSDNGTADTIEVTIASGVTINGNTSGGGVYSDEGDVAIIKNYGTITGSVPCNEGYDIRNYGTLNQISIYSGVATFSGGFAEAILLHEEGSLTVDATSTVGVFTYLMGTNSGGVLDGSGTLVVTGQLDVEAPLSTDVTFQVNSDTLLNAAVDITVLDENGISYAIPAGTEWGMLETLYDYSFSEDSITFESEIIGYQNVESQSLTVTNTGSLDQEVTYEHELVDAFDVEATGLTDGVLASDSELTFTVTPKLGLAIGTYSDVITVMISGRELAFPISLEVTDKLTSEGSIDMPDYIYGEQIPAYTMECGSHALENAIIQYKKKGTSDTTLTTEVPIEVGNYVVKATFPETDTVKEMKLKDTFKISYLKAPESPYVITGTKGENGFYRSKVTITPAEGYQIATALGGSYVSALQLGSSQRASMVYLRSAETGGMTAGIALDAIKIDAKLPTFLEVEDGSVNYGDTLQLSVTDLNLTRLTVNGEEVAVMGQTATVTLRSNNGVEEYRLIATDAAGNSKMINILVAAEWTKDGIVPSGQLVRLQKTNAYKLGEGNWHVEGDATSYAGGNTFYVGSDGEYTFTKE